MEGLRSRLDGVRAALNAPERAPLRRVLKVGTGVAGALILAVVSVLAFDLIRARNALVTAESQALELKSQIRDGDVAAAESTLKELQASTRRAADSTDGRVVAAAGAIPLVGKNVDAVRSVSQVMARLSDEGLDPLVGIADQANAQSFSPANGRIDLAAVGELARPLAEADRAFTRGAAGLTDLDAGSLLGPLSRAVASVQEEVAEAQSGLRAGMQAAELLPPMLGAAENRRYALVFQNNAEIRSTGGLPGAYAIVSAEAGRMSLVGQGAAADFPYEGDASLKPSKDERDLYGEALTGYWGDSNFTPDFPRTAHIMSSMLASVKSESVDGVVSVDPVALSYILRGTGPVVMSDGEQLTSSNAVDLLLHDAYLRFDDTEQNLYFAEAARRVFEAVSSGQGDSTAVVSGMAKGVAENRIMVWSKRPAEQKVLESSRIAGALPGDEGPVPHLGIYFNDATETKLEYFLRGRTRVTAESCSSDGVQTLKTRTVLQSTAPKNGRGLSASVIGNDTGEPKGSFRMVLAFYLPHGGIMTDLAIDGEQTDPLYHEHNGLTVITKPVLLGPGKTVAVTSTIVTGRGQRGDPQLRMTPLVHAAQNVVSRSACD